MMPEFDDIAGIDESLFTGDSPSGKLLLTFIAQTSKTNTQMIATQKSVEKHILQLAQSIEKLTAYSVDQRVHNEQVQSQIKALIESNISRKKDIERIEAMAQKALNKTDALSDAINDACSVNSNLVTKASKEYTDKEVETFEGKVRLGFLVAKIASSFAFILLTIIGWFILDKMDNISTSITENTKMIKENREQNLRTYDNLNSFKEYITKDKK